MIQRIIKYVKQALAYPGKGVGGIWAWLRCRFEGAYESGENSTRPEKIYRRKQLSHVVFSAVFAGLLSVLIIAPTPGEQALPDLESGDLVGMDVHSPLTVLLEQKELTPDDRDRLIKKIPPVFDFDERAISNWIQAWEKTFQTLRLELSGNRNRTGIEFLQKTASQIHELTGQTLKTEDIVFLYQAQFREDLEKLFIALARPLQGRLISPEDLFPSYYATGIVVRQVHLNLNEVLIQDVSRIWSVDHARQLIAHVLTTLPKKDDPARKRIATIVQSLIIPNLIYNAALTQKRIQGIVQERAVPSRWIHRGELLLRKGERISERQKELIGTLRQLTSWRSRAWQFLGLFAALFMSGIVFFKLELGRKSFWKLSLKNAGVLLGITAANLALVKYLTPVLLQLGNQYSVPIGIEYLIPVAIGPMITHLILGKELAYTVALMVAVASGAWMDLSWSYTLWVIVISFSAIQTLGACKQRADIFRSGAFSGRNSAVLILAITVLENLGRPSVDWMAVSSACGFSFISGMMAAIFTGALVPLMEWAFGYTTSLKLLELSNFNHPLLHDLMMKAPGTYHHSVIAGSLAEIAADRVKANPLLARVGAYYHDIGKITKPLYFIENQSPMHNPHDSVTPSISAKILFAHVKIGVKMSHEHQLGDDITGIIEQHHGTTLISYFFNKARNTSAGHGHEHTEVNEADFRYPGPKPQTREAAIVMLADSCEAATRSINDPTPQKIQNMVRNIINNRFLEQQFSDCDLTLNDLKIIEETFVRTLVSIYHNRIEYPGQRNVVNG